MARDAIAIIMGGGQDTRLYPLTKHRARPVCAGSRQLQVIDTPIGNCLHSSVERIFVLTRLNSTLLSRYIVQTYRFDALTP